MRYIDNVNELFFFFFLSASFVMLQLQYIPKYSAGYYCLVSTYSGAVALDKAL